jgi:hypothetical protein
MEPNQIPNPGAQQSPSVPAKSFGPIIGIAVIVIALVVGALYFWGEALVKEDAALVPVSQPDEIDSIEADLDSRSSADIDFSDIESDLR